MDVREETEEEVKAQFTKEEIDDILRMKADQKLYQNMVNSIAPAIYGLPLFLFFISSYFSILSVSRS